MEPLRNYDILHEMKNLLESCDTDEEKNIWDLKNFDRTIAVIYCSQHDTTNMDTGNERR